MKVEPAYAQESQEISPALRVPNAETRAAMEEARAIMKARPARFDSVDALIDDLEKARQ
jgi:DNA-damage-inducible protein J